MSYGSDSTQANPGQQGGNKNQQATNTPAPLGDGGPASLEALLSMFCGTSHRYALEKPWNKGGKRWYSNRVSVFWVPTSDADSVHEKGFTYPDAGKAVESRGEPITPYQPIGSIAEPEKCEECGGSLIVPEKACSECAWTVRTKVNGEWKQVVKSLGRVECCECGQDTDCEECNGTGKIPGGPCDACSHGYKTRFAKTINVCGVLVEPSLAWFASKLPNVEVAAGTDCLFVRFDGGSGLIMGSNP